MKYPRPHFVYPENQRPKRVLLREKTLMKLSMHLVTLLSDFSFLWGVESGQEKCWWAITHLHVLLQLFQDGINTTTWRSLSLSFLRPQLATIRKLDTFPLVLPDISIFTVPWQGNHLSSCFSHCRGGGPGGGSLRQPIVGTPQEHPD